MKTQISLLITLSLFSTCIRAEPWLSLLNNKKEELLKNSPYNPEQTPLHKAAREDRYDVTAILTRFKESEGKIGEYLQTKNEAGRTPLEEAQYYTAVDKASGRIDTSDATSFGELFVEKLHKGYKDAVNKQYFELLNNTYAAYLVQHFAQHEALIGATLRTAEIERPIERP